MKPLPAGLAEPLHLLEPSNWRGWVVAGLATLLVAAIACWVFYRRRFDARRRIQPRTAQASPPGPHEQGIADAIESIRLRFSRRGLARAGCHALSAALRTHLERRKPIRYSILTAREIGRRLGDTPLTRLLALLSDLQFGRREPARGDLEGLCDLAHEVVSRPGDGGG